LAKKKLAEVNAVFLPVDRSFYEETSNNIMSILRHYADSFEKVGIDEAYLDVTEGANGSFKEAKRLPKELWME